MSDANVTAPEQRRVRWYHLIVPIVAMAGAFLAAGLAIGVVAAASMNPGDMQSEPDMRQALMAWLTDPTTKFIVLHVILAAAYLAFLLALTWLLGPVGRARMVADFGPLPGGQVVLGLIAGVVLAVGSMAFIGWLASKGMSFEENKTQQEVMPHDWAELLMAGSTIAILGPFAEELYFRGALLSWLRDKAGLAFAIVVSAILFGLAHFYFLAMPDAQGWILTGVIVAIGLVNGVWAARSGSLWPPFATHAAFNGTMVAVALIAPDLAT